MVKGKHKKNRSKVFFEEEIVKKETADKILNNVPSYKIKDENVTDLLETEQENDQFIKDVGQSNNVKKSMKIKQTIKKEIKNPGSEIKEPPKKKMKNNKSEIEDVNDQEEVEEESENVVVEQSNSKTTESKRAMKRNKHAKLLEEKKLKSDLKMQQNCLNYLSKWKYSKIDWKFEKLKQVWLHQNLFDSSKLSDEVWKTALEYFGGSKGFIRNAVLKNALKIIEEDEKSGNDNLDNDVDNSKLKRARDIVQSLQE